MVSICIPVYNGSRTIKKTIESALSQTYKDIEVIIVDNASKDNTVSIVQQMKDKRIRLHCNDNNLGMAGNWNKCLEYVKGEYVHFLCADDLLEPECIEEKVKKIESDKTIAMVFGASAIINDKDVVLMKRHPFSNDKIMDGKKLARKAFLTKNLYGEPSNVLFRTALIKRTGLFALNLCYATDLDFWIRLSCCGKVGYVDKELMRYRIADSNETSKIKMDKFINDDKQLLLNIEEYHCIRLTSFDKMIHRIIHILRMYARVIYMKIKC